MQRHTLPSISNKLVEKTHTTSKRMFVSPLRRQAQHHRNRTSCLGAGVVSVCLEPPKHACSPGRGTSGSSLHCCSCVQARQPAPPTRHAGLPAGYVSERKENSSKRVAPFCGGGLGGPCILLQLRTPPRTMICRGSTQAAGRL